MYNNLIKWPLYEIGAHVTIKEENKVLSLVTPYNKEYVIDNKNVSGSTLGVRRSRIKNSVLYPLKKIRLSVYDLFHTKCRTFIDSAGIIFTLKKKKTRKLIYKQVLDTTVTAKGTVLCKCAGIYKLIEIPFLPKIMPRYLGLLLVEGDYYVYSLEEESKQNTWRLW